MCKHKSGNFSSLDQKSRNIVITPTGLDRELLNSEDLIVMDLEDVIESLSRLKPTKPALMHIMIYKTREDAKAVVHTHSRYGTTFALLNKSIPAIVHELVKVPIRPEFRSLLTGVRGQWIWHVQSLKHVKKQSVSCWRNMVAAFDTRNIEEAYLKANYIENWHSFILMLCL